MKKKFTFILFGVICSLNIIAQANTKERDWKWKITKNGFIEYLVFQNGQKNDTIPFFSEEGKQGPQFYIKTQDKELFGKWTSCGDNVFKTSIEGVDCEIAYTQHHSKPAIIITMRNNSHVIFQPQKAGLKIGIDTYMDKYPEWFNKYFPTLMRCEKTHFYGYMQTPTQQAIAIVSEQPIASWSVDYSLGYMSPPPHWFMGHRIESFNIDLLNQLPLPDHNPQHLYQLLPSESKKWIISFLNVGTDLNNLEQTIREVANIPLISIDKTSYRPGDSAIFKIFGDNPIVNIKNDNDSTMPIAVSNKKDGYLEVSAILPKVGLYNISVLDGDKKASAILSAHQSWQWVLENAREATLKYHQKATSHAESWYGFYSAFIAAKYFPNKTLDEAVNKRFNYLFDLLHDQEKMEPKYYISRIQNTSSTIGMLVGKYEAGGDIEDLQKASRLADWLIRSSQREDGAYYNHGTIYTSVIYIAKSMLELSIAEKKLSKADPSWAEASARHYNSAKKAIDQLVDLDGNFQTEGEHTFEDGMISCSALQIGMLALMQEDKAQQEYYTKAMLDILNSHNCLTQLKVPDARRRQGTMRYWEAQYDVMMLPNMFNSPHGWSAWRAYATYYAYLLTGEQHWLQETFNAAGAFANLLDYKNGKLRWAFVVDPHLQVEQTCNIDERYTADSLSFDNPHPHLYQTRKFIIGEQYIDMVSDWQTVNTQDNDVHEVFKYIGEAVLTNAFIIEHPNGEIEAYNCSVTKKGNKLDVQSYEKQITNLHCNLQDAYTIHFKAKDKTILTKETNAKFRGWLNSVN